ncbi:MAG: hypothetical protein EAZ44_04535 [Cytophagia bacterium]|nr:MAG: hypothetical protein EAZ44_04535 [Cytophagia bacterium]
MHKDIKKKRIVVYFLFFLYNKIIKERLKLVFNLFLSLIDLKNVQFTEKQFFFSIYFDFFSK